MISHFYAVVRTEMRLAWRRRSFWLIQLLWLLPLLSNSTLPRNIYNELGVVRNMLETLISMGFLLLPIIVGPALLRDLREQGELVWATPLSAFTHLLGMLVGLYLALLPFLLMQLAARWAVPALVWNHPGAALVWRYGLPLVLVSMGAGIALVALLALLLRRLLLLLLVSTGLWFGNIALISGLTTVKSDSLDSSLNLFFSGLQVSPALGLGLSRPLVFGLAWWLVGLTAVTVMVALAAALVSDRRRALARPPLVALALVAALLLALSGFAAHARAVQAQTPARSPYENHADEWRVLAHEMVVTVGESSLRGQSRLQLEPANAVSAAPLTLVLRLNPGLTLLEAAGERGALEHAREGDSVIITLPETPAYPLDVRLVWEGSPRPAYADYGSGVAFYWPSYTTPQPIAGLLMEGVGYLLRDGDWHPWPWSRHSHHATRTRVTVRSDVAGALAAAPLREGEVTWEGRLPPALLVLPPDKRVEAGAATLHIGAGMGEVQRERLTRFSALAPRLADAIGEATPRHVVALPYLSEIVWSGDLLLLPEGTGYRDRSLIEAFAEAESEGVEERAMLMALARAWLASYLSIEPGGFAWVEPGQSSLVVDASLHDPTAGRWIRAPAGIALPPPEAESQVPMGVPETEPLEEFALWVALEVADADVREADLALLRRASAPIEIEDEGAVEQRLAQFAQYHARLLPVDMLMNGGDPALVPALHRWTERVGRERALLLLGGVVREGGAFDITALLVQFEAASGVEIREAGGEGEP